MAQFCQEITIIILCLSKPKIINEKSMFLQFCNWIMFLSHGVLLSHVFNDVFCRTVMRCCTL